jgi:flagellar biosynthesis/type III secretory pathway protein FliH
MNAHGDRRRQLAAQVASSRTRSLEDARREAWQSGYRAGYSDGAEWSAGRAWEAAIAESEEDTELAFNAGQFAGEAQARADADEVWRAGYADGLADHAAVVIELKARIAALEEEACHHES